MALNIEDVSAYGNVVVAYAKACKGKKHYRQVKEFDEDKLGNIRSLQEDFANGTYRTSGYVLKTIKDSHKEREIAKTILFRDRVAHWMIANELVPKLMSEYFSEHSHAAMPGRGIHTALEQTQKMVEDTENARFCLKLDIKKFFPSVDREVLKVLVRRIFRNAPMLAQIVCNIIDDAPKTGIPIGNLLSQYLANIVLTPLDRMLERITRFFVRYMDDLVIFASSTIELRKILREVEWFLESRLHLKIKPNWQIFRTAPRGVDFVGYRIFPGRIMLRKSTFAKMRRMCAKVLKNARAYGCITDRERSQVMSYLGWIVYCSQGDVDYLFFKYFAPILEAAGQKLTKKLQKKLWKQQKESDIRSERSQQTQLFTMGTSGSISSPT